MQRGRRGAGSRRTSAQRGPVLSEKLQEFTIVSGTASCRLDLFVVLSPLPTFTHQAADAVVACSFLFFLPGVKEHSRIVARQNKLSSRVKPVAANMQKMVWSEKLALLAKTRAATCEIDGPPQHASPFSHVGWNTHLSADGVTSFSDAIHSCFDEGEDFLYLSGQCRENATCHYIQAQTRNRLMFAHVWVQSCWCSVSKYSVVVQVVWATSSNVGRASQLCVGNRDVSQIFVLITPGNNYRINIIVLLNFYFLVCSVQGVRGRFEEECSCRCDVGYGGAECAVISCHNTESGLALFYSLRNQGRRGILVQIPNQKVQDILAFDLSQLESSIKVTNTRSETRNFWIGLTCKPLKDSFRWDTGEKLAFRSFAFGQPDSRLSNCVELQASSVFIWNDQRCKTQNRYICLYGEAPSGYR
ncbi:LOW QUALITY PROTEIN: C-type lectin domain family 18 member A-like [Spinachia spinachia]